MALAPLGSGWAPLIERALAALAEQGFRAPEGTGNADGGVAIPRRLAALTTYLDEVARWNEKTDLTAARTPEELVDLTVADAIVVSSSGAAVSGASIDVGTGAGAPGLVVALLAPSIRMTLVEPRDRRVAFLRSMVGRLALEGVTIERGRSDRLAGGAWDVALSRATLPPPEWLREGARLAHSVWVLLAREEAPSTPGYGIVEDHPYTWPLTHAPRRAVRYRATEPTDAIG